MNQSFERFEKPMRKALPDVIMPALDFELPSIIIENVVDKSFLEVISIKRKNLAKKRRKLFK